MVHNIKGKTNRAIRIRNTITGRRGGGGITSSSQYKEHNRNYSVFGWHRYKALSLNYRPIYQYIKNLAELNREEYLNYILRIVFISDIYIYILF